MIYQKNNENIWNVNNSRYLLASVVLNLHKNLHIFRKLFTYLHIIYVSSDCGRCNSILNSNILLLNSISFLSKIEVAASQNQSFKVLALLLPRLAHSETIRVVKRSARFSNTTKERIYTWYYINLFSSRSKTSAHSQTKQLAMDAIKKGHLSYSITICRVRVSIMITC